MGRKSLWTKLNFKKDSRLSVILSISRTVIFHTHKQNAPSRASPEGKLLLFIHRRRQTHTPSSIKLNLQWYEMTLQFAQSG